MECVLHAKLRNTGIGLVKDWTGKDKDTRTKPTRTRTGTMD